MGRLTYEEKLAEIQILTADDRPLMRITKQRDAGDALEYDSESIRHRSRRTATKRVKRYR